MRRSLVAAFVGTVAALGLDASAQAKLPTVVSFGFDDGTADQLGAAQALEAQRMRGTFFVNSGKAGGPGYLGWEDITGLQDRGHEIGGHTKDHRNLTVDGVDVQDQVCGDFTALLDHGLDVTSFAYPNGADSPSIHGVVRSCVGPGGERYTSARTTRGLTANTTGPVPDCDRCSEPLPLGPAWAFRTRAYQIRPSATADAEMITAIAAARDDLPRQAAIAESFGVPYDGAWLQLVLHDVCDTRCSPTDFGITLDQFEAVLAWVRSRPASDCIVVRTVNEVVNRPLPACPDDPPGPPMDPGSGGGGSTGGGGGGGAATPAATSTEVVPPAAGPPAADPPRPTPAPTPVSISVVAQAPSRSPFTVALVAPRRGTAVRGTLTLGATVSPATPGLRVEYLVGGRVVATRTRAPYTVRLRTAALRPGRVVVSVRATDAAGTVVRGGSRSLRVIANTSHTKGRR